VPSVLFLRPNAGATFAAPALVPIEVSATSANSTISKVEFFANSVKLGESNTPPYKYAWINAPAGAHRVSATATDALGVSANSGNFNVTVASSVTLSNIAFNGINAPLGSTTTIANDRVMVTGKVVMPLNAALGINGYLVSADQDGNFFVNNVLLKNGNNTITFTINQFGAPQVTETRVVNATALQEFVLSINPTEAVAPASFKLTVNREGPTPFDRIELIGNGTLIGTLTAVNFNGNTAVFNIGSVMTPSEITIVANAFAPNATTPFYTGTIKARVTDGQDTAVKVKAVLEQFRAKLLVSDVTGAVQFFTEPLRDYYQTRLTIIAPDLPSLAAELANPVSISIQGDTATAVISRQVGPNTFTFTLSLIRDADAIWRIDGM
jgi:Bacterial Ig domain